MSAHGDDQGRRWSQRSFELMQLAEDSVEAKMGAALPESVRAEARYWFARFIDIGRELESEKWCDRVAALERTIETMKRADARRTQ